MLNTRRLVKLMACTQGSKKAFSDAANVKAALTMNVRSVLRNSHKKSDWPKEEWARVYIDDSTASSEAVVLLRKSGYPVITFPVQGSVAPRLVLRGRSYNNLQEIKNFVNSKE